MWPRGVADVDGRTDGRRSGGRHGRQAASADRHRAGIDGSGGRPGAWLTAGGQSTISLHSIVACQNYTSICTNLKRLKHLTIHYL